MKVAVNVGVALILCGCAGYPDKVEDCESWAGSMWEQFMSGEPMMNAHIPGIRKRNIADCRSAHHAATVEAERSEERRPE